MMVECLEDFAPDVLEIVAQHHVSPDNLGYPREHSALATTEVCRVVGIVDRYDDLIRNQLKLTPLPHLALRQVYREAQTNRLDLRLASIFVKLVGTYPKYSLVQMNTGEIGVVTGVSSDRLLKPEVALIKDADGRPYPTPLRIDLAHKTPGMTDRSIAHVLDPDLHGMRIEDLLSAAGSGSC
jgi:hypothetical protein